jgi:hypothetical protein
LKLKSRHGRKNYKIRKKLIIEITVDLNDSMLDNIGGHGQFLGCKGDWNFGLPNCFSRFIIQERQVCRPRIGRLMGATGLVCKTKRKVKATMNSNSNLSLAPNHLDRQFMVS